MRRGLPIAALLVSTVFALSGCGGGSVAIRSGFPAHGAPPPPPAGGAHAGLSVSGGSGLALALVLGLIIADGVYCATNRLQQGSGDPAPTEAPRPLLQRIDRGWVDRGP
ncbi:MAG: hypothetical protein GEV05_16905 [Betaproteobacteria bacterium]|nr:hypothetical protein [Betaproteobacteria bacterium]